MRFFSHLINCQYRWMARILQDPKAQEMDWWDPVYELNELEDKWDDSLNIWLKYIDQRSAKELFSEIILSGLQGGRYATSVGDIGIQLCYHSIHHRAQLQTIIREQGQSPDFVDYIETRFREVN